MSLEQKILEWLDRADADAALRAMDGIRAMLEVQCDCRGRIPYHSFGCDVRAGMIRALADAIEGKE